MPTTGITGASAIGHRLFQFGSFTCRFDDDADPDDCSADDDDIEDDIKEGERERNRQKFVTYVSCDEWERGARINNTREILRTDDDDDDDDYTFLVCVLQQTDL